MRLACTGVVCLLLGACSVLDVTARFIDIGDKGLLGESELHTCGSAGLLGGEVGLLDENLARESSAGSVDRELLECSADRELLGGSEDRELVGGRVLCEIVDRNDKRALRRDRVSCETGGRALGGEDWRKLAFLSSFGVHVMKRLVTLELTGLISSEAFDLPLSDENTFL